MEAGEEPCQVRHLLAAVAQDRAQTEGDERVGSQQERRAHDGTGSGRVGQRDLRVRGRPVAVVAQERLRRDESERGRRKRDREDDDAQEDRLRGWLAKRGVKSNGEPEYAFYNSPMIPGPLRRNEVWLALS